jgi:hypothetical protein
VTGGARLAAGFYLGAYCLAVWAGTRALGNGTPLAVAALFTAAAGLLLGLHREFRHTAARARLVIVCGTPPATGAPPGCRCETWWTSLGAAHDPTCPAHARKDTR